MNASDFRKYSTDIDSLSAECGSVPEYCSKTRFIKTIVLTEQLWKHRFEHYKHNISGI